MGILAIITIGFYIVSKNKISKFQFGGFNPFVTERILTAIPVSDDQSALE